MSEVIIAHLLAVALVCLLLFINELPEDKHFCRNTNKKEKYDLIVHRGYNIIGHKCSQCKQFLPTKNKE